LWEKAGVEVAPWKTCLSPVPLDLEIILMIRKSFTIVLRLCIGLIASFIVFTLVSFLHGFFGDTLQNKPVLVHPQITPVVMPKKRDEEPKTQQHIRIVKTNTGKNGSTGTGQSNERFVPDLNPEAGPDNGNGVALGTGDLGAEVFEEGQTDDPAVAVYTPEVPFPDQARENNIQGIVRAIFVVNYQGKVTNIDVVQSPDLSFAREVKRILATWRFKPARNKGIPVNVRFSKEIEFKLE
jgi:TonB family protein